MNRRPQLKLIAPSASPEEAAAVSAALEQFMRDHAPAAVESGAQVNRWLRTALLEGVDREPHGLTWWGEPPSWGANRKPSS